MKLKKFKERDNKRIGIIVFTIICILLVCGAVLYRTFAIFEVKTNQNVINGQVQGLGDIEFAFYVDGEIDKKVPEKGTGYTLNTETSKCIDMLTGNQSSNISWDNEKWEAHLKNITTTKTKCYLYFDKLYVDSTLRQSDENVGPIPDLGNELVAITFDETGHAKKADLTKEWYNYGKQEWANAVILRSKQDYKVGDVIPEENIESYFVWIPRYRYQIWNGQAETDKYTGVQSLGVIDNANTKTELNQQKEIQIEFETKNKEIRTGSSIGEWLTHPAFTSFDSNGLWVGKFETGYNQDAEGESDVTPKDWTIGGAQVNKIASDKVIIKPNVYSWRNIQVANAFYTVYNYKRELDSHMMKNMEWGAVAYLTNSKYGRCFSENCSDVRINNNSSYITGNSAVKEPTCGYASTNNGTNTSCNQYGTSSSVVNNYNNLESVHSSTTDNYYGIFDMAGGAWEYVMGVMEDQNGKPASGRNNVLNSNFVGTLTCPTCKDSDKVNQDKAEWTKDDGGLEWPEKKYYDTYAYDKIVQDFQRGLFGDGTKEFGPFYEGIYSSWHADDAFFVASYIPWFIRGGAYSYGTSTGTANFNNKYGHTSSDTSFRVILTP